MFSLILAAITYLSFIWGAIFYFKLNSPAAKKGKDIISALGLTATITALHGVYSTQDRQLDVESIVGVFFLGVSCLLFWCSILATRRVTMDFAFSTTKPNALVIQGPYKYVRHPFYTSYSLAWIAGVLLSNSAFLAILTIILCTLYVKSARQEEQIFLSSNHSQNYQKYQQATGMFFPRITKRAAINDNER